MQQHAAPASFGPSVGSPEVRWPPEGWPVDGWPDPTIPWLPDRDGHPVLEAYDRLAGHGELDGEGIQLAVDLDCALAGAGMDPHLADALSREELAAALAEAPTGAPTGAPVFEGGPTLLDKPSSAA